MNLFSTVSDEELLLLSRSGNLAAENALAERYFAMRFRFCRIASPSLTALLDDWTLNEAHFRAFLSATMNYEFQKARFCTFYIHVLAHELQDSYEAKRRQFPNSVVSLDANLDVHDGDLVLCDIVPTPDQAEDPKAFLLYSEALLNTDSKLPRGIDGSVIRAARLASEGYSREEIAIACKMRVNQVKYSLGKYRRWAMRVLSSAFGWSEEETKAKEKLLSRFLHAEEE